MDLQELADRAIAKARSRYDERVLNSLSPVANAPTFYAGDGTVVGLDGQPINTKIITTGAISPGDPVIQRDGTTYAQPRVKPVVVEPDDNETYDIKVLFQHGLDVKIGGDRDKPETIFSLDIKQPRLGVNPRPAINSLGKDKKDWLAFFVYPRGYLNTVYYWKYGNKPESNAYISSGDDPRLNAMSTASYLGHGVFVAVTKKKLDGTYTNNPLVFVSPEIFPGNYGFLDPGIFYYLKATADATETINTGLAVFNGAIDEQANAHFILAQTSSEKPRVTEPFTAIAQTTTVSGTTVAQRVTANIVVPTIINNDYSKSYGIRYQGYEDYTTSTISLTKNNYYYDRNTGVQEASVPSNQAFLADQTFLGDGFLGANWIDNSIWVVSLDNGLTQIPKNRPFRVKVQQWKYDEPTKQFLKKKTIKAKIKSLGVTSDSDYFQFFSCSYYPRKKF